MAHGFKVVTKSISMNVVFEVRLVKKVNILYEKTHFKIMLFQLSEKTNNKKLFSFLKMFFNKKFQKINIELHFFVWFLECIYLCCISFILFKILHSLLGMIIMIYKILSNFIVWKVANNYVK